MKIEKFKVPAASHLFLMRNSEVLLHLRKNSSFENMYGVVAGHLNGGETATQALIREAKEEAGITIDKEDVKIATISHSKASNNEYIQFFFFCEKWSGEIINMEKEKCSELKFFPIDNLPNNMVPYVEKAIKSARDDVKYFEYGW